MNKTRIDCSIKDWYIIDVVQLNEPVIQVLWGIVIDDFKGRFKPGDYVSTSSIIKVDSPLVYTLNSVYKTVGTGKKVALHRDASVWLRQGYSPDEIISMNASG